MFVRLPGQGFMPSPPLELPMELIILRHIKGNIPLREDVPGVHVLLIALSGSLRNESRGVIGLLGSGSGCLSLSRGHLHQKNHMN